MTDAMPHRLLEPEAGDDAIRADLAAQNGPEAVAQRISDLATSWAGAGVGTVFLRRLWNNRDRYVPAVTTGAKLSAFPELPALNPARVNPESLFGGVFVRLEPCHIPDVQAHPAFHGLPKPHPPVRSMLATPLFDAAGESRGVLVLGHREPNRFDATGFESVRRLAELAGERLADLRLFDPPAGEP